MKLNPFHILRFIGKLFWPLVTALALAMIALPAFAQGGGPTTGPTLIPPVPVETAFNVILLVIGAWGGSTAVNGLVAGLVNFLKPFGIVRDGTAARWYSAINLVLFLGVVVALLFVPALKFEVLQGWIGSAAIIVGFVAVYVRTIINGPDIHEALVSTGLPGVSASRSKT